MEESNTSQGRPLKIPANDRREEIQEKQVGFDKNTGHSWSGKPCRGTRWDTSSDNQSQRVNEQVGTGTTLPEDTAPGQRETFQRPHESS